MDWFTGNVADGIVSGVSTGIVLAAFFGVVDCIRSRRRRADQIRYLDNLIADHQDEILGVHADIPHPEPAGDPITVAQQQHLYYGALLRQLEAALSGRASQLTYDEIGSVRSIFWGVYGRLLPDRPWPEEWYVMMLQSAESIQWLGLTPASNVAD